MNGNVLPRPVIQALATAAGVLAFAGYMNWLNGSGSEPAVGHAGGENVANDVYRGDGSDWRIDCFGRQAVLAVDGDTLSGLVEDNVYIVDPADVGRPDLSREAVVEAAADAADIPNPDEIEADRVYELPIRCQPGT